MNDLKGVTGYVYRSAALSAARGSHGAPGDPVRVLCADVDRVTVVGPWPMGAPDMALEEASGSAPAVRVVERVLFGAVHVHLEPVEKPEGMVGPMSGGAYVRVVDRMFPLHDRFETTAAYKALSK